MQESVKPKLGFGILKAKNILMINEIQKLINKWREEAVGEKENAEILSKAQLYPEAYKSHLLSYQLFICANEVELLLKEETAKDLPDDECTCSGAYTNPNCPLHYKR